MKIIIDNAQHTPKLMFVNEKKELARIYFCSDGLDCDMKKIDKVLQQLPKKDGIKFNENESNQKQAK